MFYQSMISVCKKQRSECTGFESFQPGRGLKDWRKGGVHTRRSRRSICGGVLRSLKLSRSGNLRMFYLPPTQQAFLVLSYQALTYSPVLIRLQTKFTSQ